MVRIEQIWLLENHIFEVLMSVNCNLDDWPSLRYCPGYSCLQPWQVKKAIKNVVFNEIAITLIQKGKTDVYIINGIIKMSQFNEKKYWN